MKHANEKRQSKRLKNILVLMGVVAAVVVVAAISVVYLANSGEGDILPDGVRASLDSTEGDTADGQNVSMVFVDTPYVQLSYPAAFSDLVTPRVTEKKDEYKVSFESKIDGESTALYSVSFGGSDGELLGTIESQAGEAIDVRLIVEDFDTSDLGKDDLDSYHAAKDTLNDVVASIASNNGFVRAA